MLEISFRSAKFSHHGLSFEADVFVMGLLRPSLRASVALWYGCLLVCERLRVQDWSVKVEVAGVEHSLP